METIRYYERHGLLPKVPRTASWYRQFSADHAIRLRFIRRAQELGFTLREIQELLALRVKPGSGCADVCRKAQAKIADVDGKIRHPDHQESPPEVDSQVRGAGSGDKLLDS